MSNRLKRHKRIRRKIKGDESKPRLSVFRSTKNMQAQLIDDEKRVTLAGMSTIEFAKEKLTKSEKAKKLGIELGKKILGIENGKYKSIVFDRGGYKYHGRVKALADGLRESGLQF